MSIFKQLVIRDSGPGIMSDEDLAAMIKRQDEARAIEEHMRKTRPVLTGPATFAWDLPPVTGAAGSPPTRTR